jgi:hypothetical protein
VSVGRAEFVSLVGQFDKGRENGKIGNVPREIERPFKGISGSGVGAIRQRDRERLRLRKCPGGDLPEDL